MKARELKEILNGLNDEADVLTGKEESCNMYDVVAYEYPDGDKSEWSFINLVHD
jgi:hypothetical protein